MKPRARRIAFLTVAAGCLVVGGLLVAHWGTVRDHVEAWHFQLTTETETILPDPACLEACKKTDGYVLGVSRDLLCLLATTSGRPVVATRHAFKGQQSMLEISRAPTTELALYLLLEAQGCRILEQRFPHSAYCVIADQPRTLIDFESYLESFERERR